MKILLSLVVFALGIAIFFVAKRKSQQHQFYSDTSWLIPMGIFVWGDGLVLGVFWSLVGLAIPFISWITLFRVYVLFYTIRSAYEVVYWINHQVAKKDYSPPLIRHFSWLNPEEAGIIYQLINMCWVVGGLVVLMLTWQV